MTTNIDEIGASEGATGATGSKGKKLKYFTLTEIAAKFGVSRQGVAYQVKWRGLGIMARGKIIVSSDEVKELVFRRPNSTKED